MNKRGALSIEFVVMLGITSLLFLTTRSLIDNLSEKFPVNTIRQGVFVPQGIHIPVVATGFANGNPCSKSLCVDYKIFQSFIKESEIQNVFPTEDGTFWYCAEKEGKKYSTSTNVIDQEKIKEKIGQRWYGLLLKPVIKVSDVSQPETSDLEKTPVYVDMTIEKYREGYFALIFISLILFLFFLLITCAVWQEF